MQKNYWIYGLITVTVVAATYFYLSAQPDPQANVPVQNVIQYSSPSNFQVVLPPGYPEARDGGMDNVQQSVGDTCATVVLEYGDGTFTTMFQSVHNYNQMPQGNMFAAITRYYDTTDFPEMFARTTNGVVQTNTPNASTPLLSSQQSFRLIPHVNSVIPNQTSHFIVPFRNTRSLFICFYNSYQSNFFSRINAPGSTMQINGLSIPFIRVHNNQLVFTAINNIPGEAFPGFLDLKTALTNLINTQMTTGHRFADYFIVYNDNEKVSASASSAIEKNMFFSLPPTNDYADEDLDELITTVRLYNFDLSSKSISSSFIDQQLQFIAGPHDPNNILINPDCVSKPDTKHELTINFQNLGLGDVQNHIIIKATVPKHIAQDLQLSEIVVGAKPVNISVVNQAGSGYQLIKKFSPASGSPDTIIITMKTKLDGLMGMSLGALNDTTKGHVKFIMLPGLATNAVPLKFTADIVFDDQPPIPTYYILDKCWRKPICKPCAQRNPENDKPTKKPKRKPFGC